jgi:hypothetical protein
VRDRSLLIAILVAALVALAALSGLDEVRSSGFEWTPGIITVIVLLLAVTFADITGVTWKAFATPTNKNDQAKVESKSVIDVALKAIAAEADPGENYTIMGVAGAWSDDGDGNPEPSADGDSYICWGIATGSVHVKAA